MASGPAITLTQLQVLKNICALSFKVNNVHSPANNLPLLQGYFDCFIALAFDESSQISQFLFNAYIQCDRIANDSETALQNADAQVIANIFGQDNPDLEKLGTVSERILSFSICFMFSLLEDPNVWKSDFIPSGEG